MKKRREDRELFFEIKVCLDLTSTLRRLARCTLSVFDRSKRLSGQLALGCRLHKRGVFVRVPQAEWSSYLRSLQYSNFCRNF